MKKIIAMLIVCAMLLLSVAAYAEGNSLTPTVVELENGVVEVYDFGENRLHAYISGDALGDACYAVESTEGIAMIESTAFTANNAAWKAYVDGLGKPIAGKLMAFHPNGSDAYSEDLPYATENALTNWGEGGSIRALTDGFVASFGDAVAADHPADAQIVNFGDTVNMAGLDFVIRNEGDDAYGIEIPAINCVYIHMMGSSVHNILTSVEHIDAFKAELEGFDYDLVLTGHHAPEGKDAVAAKIAYLTKTRELAETCTDAASFTEAMNEAFPDYAGANYLEMTAGFLFPTAE
ncbi:MAG: hypothetical protein Q4G52_01125 [Clostridia bacterium]|nr:hypothetical protein [Clostridia bacterium]